MSATHAISKLEQKYQNQISRELDRTFGIPGLSVIYWVSSNNLKNRMNKKVKAILNPGIQRVRYKVSVFSRPKKIKLPFFEGESYRL